MNFFLFKNQHDSITRKSRASNSANVTTYNFRALYNLLNVNENSRNFICQVSHLRCVCVFFFSKSRNDVKYFKNLGDSSDVQFFA